MSSFGERLRNERKARGIGLNEIGEATKISQGNLRALEANRFHQLPGGVFNRGFVRAYAEFIGLDPEEMVAAYEVEERDQEKHRLEAEAGEAATAGNAAAEPGAPTGMKTGSRRLLTVVFLLAALGAVALAAWLARPETPPGGPAPEVASPDSTAVETPVLPPSPPPERPVEVEQIGKEPSGDESPVSVPEEPPPAPAYVEPTPEIVEAPEESPEALATPPSALSVPDSGVGTRVVNRRLEGRSTIFREGDRVWFWTRILGGEPEQRIQHVWVREGAPVSSVEIVLGGPHWRAHTWKTMYPGSAGQWRAEVRDGDGRLLASEEFICERP